MLAETIEHSLTIQPPALVVDKAQSGIVCFVQRGPLDAYLHLREFLCGRRRQFETLHPVVPHRIRGY